MAGVPADPRSLQRGATSSIERRIVDPEVAGSIPANGTSSFLDDFKALPQLGGVWPVAHVAFMLQPTFVDFQAFPGIARDSTRHGCDMTTLRQCHLDARACFRFRLLRRAPH